MESLLIDPDQAREAATREDMERLQGAWEFVSGIREARMLLEDDRFTVTFKNGDVYRGVYALDPTTTPKMMDMTIREGPDKHRGKTSLLIYELDGDRLIWCPARPGTGNRPRAFPADGDTQHLCITFRRAEVSTVSPKKG